MRPDLGKRKNWRLQSSVAAGILCFLQRLLRWLHCCSVRTCWRLDAGRMPPKGAKAALPVGREKPIRTSTTTLLGTSAEVKRGVREKMNAKIKIATLDRFLEKKIKREHSVKQGRRLHRIYQNSLGLLELS
ncbi:hypothetical protein NDU88_005517 [Pleurodeles waltl]|uniref:Uncharacterized protein n=1 Tax=Pleurodeles waltl TaxID=8319 RepID=A0AAV7TU64_PLEWA|nr:hypothetical protein NDU88_005517 [Pleurodeles waltl]